MNTSKGDWTKLQDSLPLLEGMDKYQLQDIIRYNLVDMVEDAISYGSGWDCDHDCEVSEWDFRDLQNDVTTAISDHEDLVSRVEELEEQIEVLMQFHNSAKQAKELEMFDDRV